jgi:hypothetical protein
MENFYWGFLFTTHLGFELDYNSFHPHVGMYLDDDKNIVAGAYYNSERHLSLYIGYDKEINDKASIEIGAVSGYTGNPLIKPMVKLNYDKFFIAPAIESLFYDNGDVSKNIGLVIGLDWRN